LRSYDCQNALPADQAGQGMDDSAVWHGRALVAGASELSPLLQRSWGHMAAFSLDPDGHVLAFAAVDAEVTKQALKG
jgi:uncharacterized glyoxalase superfamily protein PhnB